jgi:hypothetical protein
MRMGRHSCADRSLVRGNRITSAYSVGDGYDSTGSASSRTWIAPSEMTQLCPARGKLLPARGFPSHSAPVIPWPSVIVYMRFTAGSFTISFAPEGQ